MQRIINLAIVIPTLNEEHYIGRLLDSIALQTVSPKELVVIDAKSQDNTIEEIKKRQKSIKNLRFYQIPKYTISRQRNYGVKKTHASHILFLDADMFLKKEDILEKYFEEVLKKRPDIAAATTLPDSGYWKDLIYFKLEDLFNKLLKYFRPGATARNLYVRRKVFEKACGFDEEIAVGEDYEIVHRIAGLGGKFIFLKNICIYTSARRVELEGRRKFILKIILFGIKTLLFGYKKTGIKYEFGNFKKN